MAHLPSWLMPHRVAVEPYLGDTGTDDSYGPKISNVQCRQEGELLVTATGDYSGEVKLYTRLSQRLRFPRESRVHLDGGAIGHVQAVAERKDGELGAWQHLEIAVSA